MPYGTLIDKFRSFFGLQEPPRNDFRNPIWSSDDEDDGDELYTRRQIDMYTDPLDFQQEIAKQMQDVIKTFGNMFGDMKSLLNNEDFESFSANTDQPNESDKFNSKNIRDYYLKPGYDHNAKYENSSKDIDLDGEISSHEISGLLKQKEHHGSGQIVPFHGNVESFNGNLVPGKSFCQTIITTSITKADGTKETRRIVKNGNEVIEETTTVSGGDTRGPMNPGLDPFSDTGLIYGRVKSELSSLFSQFY